MPRLTYAGNPPGPSSSPTVGVVMPAYNAEATIEAAVRSVLAQTWSDLELVVCDDASNDGTRAVLAAIDDPRLKVVSNEVNQGQGAARDHAIAATSGDWIGVIDADDEWAPERLESLMEARGGSTSVMVFDDLMLCHDTARGLVPWRRLRGNTAFGESSRFSRDVPIEHFVTAPRLLIKPLFPAATVRAHTITHSRRLFGEDIEFFLRLASAGLRLRYVPEPLYLYRITPGSVTAASVDKSLMRHCLSECAALPGFTTETRAAIESKVDALARDEMLYEIRDLLQRGSFISALHVLFGNLSLLPSAAQRATSALRYVIDRKLKGGRRR